MLPVKVRSLVVKPPPPPTPLRAPEGALLRVCLCVVHLCTCEPVYPFTCASVSVYPCICVSAYLRICVSAYLCVCVCVYLCICVSVYLCVCVCLCESCVDHSKPGCPRKRNWNEHSCGSKWGRDHLEGPFNRQLFPSDYKAQA